MTATTWKQWTAEGVLVIEQNYGEQTMEFAPVESWRHTDKAGHAHYYSAAEGGYPTLAPVWGVPHRWVCTQCDELVLPATEHRTESFLLSMHATLDGRPVSEPEVRALLSREQARLARQERERAVLKVTRALGYPDSFAGDDPLS